MQEELLENRVRLMQSAKSVGKFINLSSVIAPSVVIGRDGELVTTWKIQGMAFETSEDITLDGAINSLNILYRSLASNKTALAVQIHRLRRPMTDELSACEEAGFAHNLSKAYNKKIGHESLMSTELYFTLIEKRKSLKKRKRTAAMIKQELLARLEVFNKISENVERSLSSFSPKRLGEYKKNDKEYSSQLSFYNFLVTGLWQEVVIPKCPLYEALMPEAIFTGSDFLEIQSANGHKFVQSLEFKDYAQSSYSGILDGLLYPDVNAVKKPYIFIETQTFCFLSRYDGQHFLELQQKQLLSSEDAGVSQIQAMSAAIDGVVNGDFSIGEYSYTLTLFADSYAEVKINTADAAKKLQDEGFLTFLSTLALPAAFFSQLPCNLALRPRLAKITSVNFAQLAPLHNFISGKRDGNPWGEALALLQTPSNQPYYFNFHTSPIGEDSFDKKTLAHTTIIGTSGSGKTVLMNFLLSMAQKYRTSTQKMTTVYFDKDRGAEIAIRALHGGYLTVENGKPTGFNPFQLESNKANIQYLISFVKLLLSMDGMPITAAEEQQIQHAVEGVMSMPKELRRLGLVPQNLTDGLTREERQNSLSVRLKKWCEGGDLGWVFDNETDLLDFDSYPNYGIDGTAFLDNKAVRTPIAFYLLKRMDQVIDGRRFIFVMDEFWKWLLDEAFRGFAFDKLKTMRKQNGFGVFATQSPSDVLNSEIAKAVIEQSATQIFLPNPKADKKEYIEGFKVSEAEFMWIQGLKEDSRMMLIKQGSRSAICKLDLGWAKEPLRVLSGSTDNINLIEQLRALVGENPDKWLSIFQKIKNDSKTVKHIQQQYGTEPELWLSHYLEEWVNED